MALLKKKLWFIAVVGVGLFLLLTYSLNGVLSKIWREKRGVEYISSAKTPPTENVVTRQVTVPLMKAKHLSHVAAKTPSTENVVTRQVTVPAIKAKRISHLAEPVLADLAQEEYSHWKVNENDSLIHNNNGNLYVEKVAKGEIVFVMVECGASHRDRQRTKSIKEKAALSFARQFKQLEVIFKSALIFTTQRLHFIFVTDTLKTFLAVRNVTRGWPQYLTKNLRLSRRSIWHPNRAKALMKIFRPCTVERLFIHEVLSDVDAAVWIDTDVLFLQSPVVLWNTLKSFNSTQMIGLAPSLYYYGSKIFPNKFRYYGKTGINAGVIVMNMTRMRNAPFKLTEEYLSTYERHKKVMPLIDQDILNDFYGRNPQYVYQLGCDWNLRHGVCMEHPFPCEEAKRGISLLHGSDVSFFREYAGSTKAVFDVFLQLGLKEEEVKQLPKLLAKSLDDVVLSGRETKCGKVPGFTNMTTFHVARHFAKSEVNM